MSELVNINGEVMPGDRPTITLDNRAFHFGDGLFESMRVVRGRLCFADAHWARLSTGAQLLRIELPPGLDRASFEHQVLELVQRNNLQGGRCRFTLYRGGGGHYRPEQQRGAYAIEVHAMEDAHHTLNEHGLMVASAV